MLFAKGLSALGGLSSHTRDKCSYLGGRCSCPRITPAYAGQILYGIDGGSYTEDHPRIRGTNSCVCIQLLDWLGSSPHTRDK